VAEEVAAKYFPEDHQHLVSHSRH